MFQSPERRENWWKVVIWSIFWSRNLSWNCFDQFLMNWLTCVLCYFDRIIDSSRTGFMHSFWWLWVTSPLCCSIWHGLVWLQTCCPCVPLASGNSYTMDENLLMVVTKACCTTKKDQTWWVWNIFTASCRPWQVTVALETIVNIFMRRWAWTNCSRSFFRSDGLLGYKIFGPQIEFSRNW